MTDDTQRAASVAAQLATAQQDQAKLKSAVRRLIDALERPDTGATVQIKNEIKGMLKP